MAKSSRVPAPMLPTPEDLREQSRRCREAARKTADTAVKRTLAACASILAQVAEAIERDDEPARKAKTEVYARLLANALKKRTRDILRLEITGEEGQVAIDPRSQIRAWRMRAEELRTTADQFSVPSAQAALRRAAANYDKMADNAQARLDTLPVRTIKGG